MAENQALYNGLGINEMMAVLMNRTWKATRATALPGLILQQNEQLLLTYLLQSSLSEELSFAARAAILEAIDDVEQLSRKQLATSRDKGYTLLTLDRIKNRLNAKPFVPQVMPPGAPIGCE
jgi:hypothetical protein